MLYVSVVSLEGSRYLTVEYLNPPKICKLADVRSLVGVVADRVLSARSVNEAVYRCPLQVASGQWSVVTNQ